MPRRSRPLYVKKSELCLRKLINNNSELLSDLLIKSKVVDRTESIEWLSPIVKDGFAEYYDKEFLERLGIERNELKVPLSAFWPSSGPRWDGLGRTNTGKLFLIEAKAHIEEAVDYSTSASSETSKELINASIDAARKYYSNSKKAYWQMPFYQYANRLAHLYYLTELNQLDAYLIFIYFCNTPDVETPTSNDEWIGHVRTVERVFALNGRCKNKVNLFINAKQL